eukprot:TRINITY_DN6813_c0_g1_i1.p1 TRINITY_DN6813_c0_g1~~TRINITY_DN6813_c0_g1_i1.p1  ORF type:complete len:89 (-),score=19.10 TRINITY_DN6813_c0_g1_i1:49-315(-)
MAFFTGMPQNNMQCPSYDFEISSMSWLPNPSGGKNNNKTNAIFVVVYQEQNARKGEHITKCQKYREIVSYSIFLLKDGVTQIENRRVI